MRRVRAVNPVYRRAHRLRNRCARFVSMRRCATGRALTVSTVCHSGSGRRRAELGRCRFRSRRGTVFYCSNCPPGSLLWSVSNSKVISPGGSFHSPCPTFRRNEIIQHWEFHWCENQAFIMSVPRQDCANVLIRGRFGAPAKACSPGATTPDRPMSFSPPARPDRLHQGAGPYDARAADAPVGPMRPFCGKSGFPKGSASVFHCG